MVPAPGCPGDMQGEPALVQVAGAGGVDARGYLGARLDRGIGAGHRQLADQPVIEDDLNVAAGRRPVGELEQ